MISVILCTHNPRGDAFGRTLAGLRGQTLALGNWELLVVDNRSDVPIVPDGVVDWHPRGRVVREEQKGLLFARIRGIAQSHGDLLLFVDDDNVLEAHYLEEVVRLSDQNLKLGTFGAGSIEPEFQEPPSRLPRIVRENLTMRAHRRAISSTDMSSRHCPSGAGMVVRRQVADLYREKVLAGLWTLATVHKLVGIPLETRGANDFDLGYQAGCLGMAMGVFPSLRLTHLMDARRLEEAYLLALLRNNGRAMALLAYVYGGHLPGKAPGWRFVWDRGWSGLLRNEREQRLLDQWREGQRDALKLVSQHAEALASLRASPAASRVS